MLKVTGTSAFLKKSKKQQALITRGAQNFARSQTRAILKDLVLNAPQWSGNTAAMWQIVTPTVGVNPENTSLYLGEGWPTLSGLESFIGDERAWRVALKAAKPALASIKYNTRINIQNPSDMAEELATDPDAEQGLRNGNYIPGDVMAVNYATAKYKLSTNVVSLADALKEDNE